MSADAETPDPAALSELCVLELAGERGAYCGKLFSDMGADVIKVEPPGGDPARRRAPFWGDEPHPDRGLAFLYANTGKRSLVLDLDDESDQARLRGLAAGADLLIESFAPGHLAARGLGYADLRRANPGLVFTSITGFGQSGPHAGYRSTDLIASAMGGAMYVIGAEEDPPVRHGGEQAHLIAAVCAASSSLIALHHRDRTGAGQHVDISTQETTVAMSHIAGIGKWLEDGIIPKRIGTGLVASVPSGAYPCKDGTVYLMVNRAAHWKALAGWIHEVTGNREVLDPMFDGPSSNRLPYRELLDLFISEMTSRLSQDEVYHEGQRRHIAFTPCSTAETIVRDPQLAARGYFLPVEHPGGRTLTYPGAPFRPIATPWRIRRRAPELGEHTREVLAEPPRTPRAPDVPENGRRDALADLRIVEFGTGMAGPWVGRFMAWCGAEVIKVESKNYPDVPRLFIPPGNPELGIQPQLSPWFTDWNAGKRFVSLDLTRPEAVELCKRVIARSDVVVANYSTGVLDKLGLGYASLREIRPELVMLSSSGYGDSGPNQHYVTWGPNIEALAGLSKFTGFPGRDCTMSHFAYPDPLSALHGIFAVMSALRERARSGRGQYIGMSQFETTVSAVGQVVLEYLANGREPRRLGNGSLHYAPHGCYPCRGEDRWCAIAIDGDDEWERLCEAAGKPEWRADARFADHAGRVAQREELDALIGAWTRSGRDYEIMSRLQAAGLAAGVVQTTEDLFERDPNLAERGFIEEIEHLKKGRVHASGIPLGLTGTPGRTRRAGEAIGQDNEYVFREIAGLSADELNRHIASGAVETADV